MLLFPARPPRFHGLPLGVALVTSKYGARTNPETGLYQPVHNGIDVAIPQGTTLLAPGAGTVETTWDNEAINGSGVKIRHTNGYSTATIHMSRVDVRRGQTVAAGTVIGLSGGAKGSYGAGRSTGPHVHFMIYGPNGSPVDPLPLTAFPGLSAQSRGGVVYAVARVAAFGQSTITEAPWWVWALLAAGAMLPAAALAIRRRST